MSDSVGVGDRYETLTWNLVMASHRRDKDEKQAVATEAERVGWLNGTQGLVHTLFVSCVHNAHPGGVTADADPMWLDKFGERCVTKHEWVRWYAGADFASAFVLNVLADRPSELAEDFKKMASSTISRYRVTLIEVLVDDYLRRPDETFEDALLVFMRMALRMKHQEVELGSLTLPYPPADPDTWQPPTRAGDR